MDWKKILITSGIIIVGIFLYLISTSYYNGEFFAGLTTSVLFPIFIVVHIILAVVFSLKEYSRKYLIAMIMIFLLNSAIVAIPFPQCDISGKSYLHQTCSCFGVKKHTLPGGSQC